ncbi:hypothetical protein [Polyangium aurulentum]|uniref:hypothetical protein n=1 Tax=Polyangium aurulentum TaxID=2567896 RepID=UPI00146DDC5E|nr:hypothetical protein [Polyangium aurulentum]UQA61739.1 hypothetical protein E8A73_015215 [Polyangium aurulentum]
MRPSGVVAVAVVMALSGVSALVTSVPPFSVGIPAWAIALNAIVGVAMFFVAFGLFKLQAWAWIVTLGVQIINGLFSLVGIANAPRALAPWLGFAVAAIVVFYLTRPHVRMAFAISDRRTTPPGMDPF